VVHLYRGAPPVRTGRGFSRPTRESAYALHPCVRIPEAVPAPPRTPQRCPAPSASN
jgi:hypothetical protein